MCTAELENKYLSDTARNKVKDKCKVQIVLDIEVHIYHSLIFHSSCFLQWQAAFRFCTETKAQQRQAGKGNQRRSALCRALPLSMGSWLGTGCGNSLGEDWEAAVLWAPKHFAKYCGFVLGKRTMDLRENRKLAVAFWSYLFGPGPVKFSQVRFMVQDYSLRFIWTFPVTQTPGFSPRSIFLTVSPTPGQQLHHAAVVSLQGLKSWTPWGVPHWIDLC